MPAQGPSHCSLPLSRVAENPHCISSSSRLIPPRAKGVALMEQGSRAFAHTSPVLCLCLLESANDWNVFSEEEFAISAAVFSSLSATYK